MSLRDTLFSAEKSLPFSLLGFILALMSAGVALYFWLNPNEAHITYDIVTNAQVLDVKEDISNLSIRYNGEDIRREHMTLSIVTVKVENDGDVDILIDMYDPRSPLGFILSPGLVVDVPSIVATSNSYLSQNLSLSWNMDSIICFSQVIFERGQSFEVKALLLHSDSASVQIKPVGKIAGVRSIPIVSSYQSKGEASFWSQVFVGNWLVQLVKCLLYAIGTLFCVAILILIVSGASTSTTRFLRRRLMQAAKRNLGLVSEFSIALMDFYIQNGPQTFGNIIISLGNPRPSIYSIVIRGLSASSESSVRNIHPWDPVSTFIVAQRLIVKAEDGSNVVDLEKGREVLLLCEYLIKRRKVRESEEYKNLRSQLTQNE